MEEALEGVEEGGEGAEKGEEGRRYFCGDGLLGGHGGWGGKSAETETTRKCTDATEATRAWAHATATLGVCQQGYVTAHITCTHGPSSGTSGLVGGMHFFPNTSKYHKYQKRMF